jgi:hypothetical protein
MKKLGLLLFLMMVLSGYVVAQSGGCQEYRYGNNHWSCLQGYQTCICGCEVTCIYINDGICTQVCSGKAGCGGGYYCDAPTKLRTVKSRVGIVEQTTEVSQLRSLFPWVTDYSLIEEISSHSADPAAVKAVLIHVQTLANSKPLGQTVKGGIGPLGANKSIVYWVLYAREHDSKSSQPTNHLLVIWDDQNGVWTSSSDIMHGPHLDPTATITFYADHWEMSDSNGQLTGKVTPSSEPYPHDWSQPHEHDLK